MSVTFFCDGTTRAQAGEKAKALAFRVPAERIETEGSLPYIFPQNPERAGWQDYVFAFHDGDETGPKMLGRIAKHTGLTPSDL